MELQKYTVLALLFMNIFSKTCEYIIITMNAHGVDNWAPVETGDTIDCGIDAYTLTGSYKFGMIPGLVLNLELLLQSH